MSTVYITLRNAVTSTLLGAIVLLHVASGFPATLTLTLERAFPMNHRIELSQLRDRDSFRHGRMFQKDNSPRGTIGFGLKGSYDPHVAGYVHNFLKLLFFIFKFMELECLSCSFGGS